MPTVFDERTITVAAANDAFRAAGFGVSLTPGVQQLEDLGGLMRAVREFRDFTEHNDPYGEHDFGEIEWQDVKVFWKVDYYNRTLSGGVSPLSPLCQRVLTVMLADEY